MVQLDQHRLKAEILRTRAAIERSELRYAVGELRNSTQTLFGVLGAVSRITRGRRARGLVSLAATVLGLMRERPLLLSTLAALAARRGVPRWLLLGGIAILCAWFVSRAVAARHETEEHAA
ncbi:MAG TPA: hypothetical protein VMG60_21820 [Burkholderiaceae bacterium]|nr:hypothetical protein [Burkholderiaceae bacterium]